MQIVINVPEDEYHKICSGNFDTNNYFKRNLKEVFKNAIPLPKEHGRLIDADELLRDRHRAIPVIEVIEAPTIIEKVEREG